VPSTASSAAASRCREHKGGGVRGSTCMVHGDTCGCLHVISQFLLLHE
jgi:hypothetical protein